VAQAVYEIITSQHGSDWQERLLGSFDYMAERVDQLRMPLMRDVWTYWQDWRRADGRLDANEFRPELVVAPEARRWLSWVDTHSDNHLDFTWHDHVYGVEGGLSDDLCDASGLTVREHPASFHVIPCALEYAICKQSEEPFYHEIEQTIGGRRRHYARLLLPIPDHNGRVTRLFYVIQRLSPALRAL